MNIPRCNLQKSTDASSELTLITHEAWLEHTIVTYIDACIAFWMFLLWDHIDSEQLSFLFGQ